LTNWKIRVADGQTIILRGNRETAHRVIDCAPVGSVVNVKPPRRTISQNDKMHAMLTDISVSCPGGRRLTRDDWKAIMMNACGWECQFIEGLDGRPFPQGFRSSKLSKAQMSSLIDFMQAWGDQNEVRWTCEDL
jgi:NinB protein